MAIFEPKVDYKVLCNCITFNQARYIIDTMTGFTIQETTFPFACYIIDDASTDGEPDVITKYLAENFDLDNAVNLDYDDVTIIIAKHKSNQNCTFAVYLLKRNLYKEQELKERYIIPWRKHCVYETICEGDDYWTMPNKLQIQVDFLDEHPDYSMHFHANARLLPNGSTIEQHRYNKDVVCCPIRHAIQYGGGYCATNSMMYRLSAYGDGYRRWAPNCPVGDLPIMLTLFARGKVAYTNIIMSAYRVLASGSWSEKMRKDKHMRLLHHRGYRETWKSFDCLTCHKYFFHVWKKILRNDLKYVKVEMYFRFPFRLPK